MLGLSGRCFSLFFFLLLLLLFFLLCHYLFASARRGPECEDKRKACPTHTLTEMENTHTCMHTQSFSKVLLLFYLPYSTCSRQSAPTRLKWILSRPFRFSAGDALMKGDSTIWTDQVAASSAQLRAKRGVGTHPSMRQKTSQASADIPITLLINTPRTWPSECVRLHVPVRAFICLCWSSTYRIVYDRPNWANWRH